MLHYLFLLLVGCVLFALLLMWREPHMIYYPTRPLDATPAAFRLAFEEVRLTTSDGVRIHGWYLPAPAAGALPSSLVTLLFFHGNAGNIADRLEKLELFHQLGAATLIIDYRGYGQSEGVPNEAGTYRDAQAAYDWLTARSGALGGHALSGNRIIVYGESLGTAIAVELATQVSVSGIILEEPFTSTADVGQKLIPYFPVRWLVQNKYDSLSKIGRLQAPLLVFHSRDDEIFPFHYAERLLAAAPDPKRLIELRGTHNDAFAVSAEIYRQGLAEFLAKQKSP